MISGVIDGIVTPDDEESEDYPCLATMLRWLVWFRANLLNIEGLLRKATNLSLADLPSSLLDTLRANNQRWLETALRIIYNSGGWLVSAG